MTASSSRYTQRHFQDFAALLAAEREQNGPSPALNRILAAVTTLLAENSANFNRELFGKAARGTVAPATRPRSLRRNRAPHEQHSPQPELTEVQQAELNAGWTPPVITWTGGAA